MTKLTTLRRMLDRKEISAVEAVQEYYKRIQEKDELYRSYVSLREEEAMEQARAAQERIDRGEAGFLCGIPMSLKDNFCVREEVTSCGSLMLSDFRPAYDADLVTGIRKSGSVILGKTAMDEFAMGNSSQTAYQGGVRNPLDPHRVPGGSSGGAAASVAADLCIWGIGTDTGGSVTQPAAFCGITGYTPTWGTLSRYGLVAFASGYDKPGILCESPADCAGILDAITQVPMHDRTLHPQRTKVFSKACGEKPVIGLPREIWSLPMADDVRADYEGLLEILRKAGYEIREVSVPGIEEAVSLYQILTTGQALSNLGRYDGLRYGLHAEGTFEEASFRARSEGFGDEVKRRILMGSFSLHDRKEGNLYQRALHGAKLLRAAFDAALSECDALLYPTTLVPPFAPHAFDDHPTMAYLADICVTGCNVARLPSLSVPFPAKSFVSMGALLVTGAHRDADLLAWGEAIYQEVRR